MLRSAILCLPCLLLTLSVAAAEPPNTQPETVRLLSPDEALATIDAPQGFEVSLFAAEPAVQQPIAMAFDTRGRLWVAECYTYAENGAFDSNLRDRILILEDTDHDGRADRRTVFWDEGQRLTGIEIGFGGVWVLCTPELLFIPDRDGDDRPDGDPVVVLDGWVPCGHTLVNGLRWGPDGWLYGRHGIQGVSQVGPPGSSAEERTPINCGIWRFHPERKSFEVVCHGTTNPWGMDWDDHGQMFFINTVIGHLWHVIPGAHYRRMYGQDLHPHLYELIEQTADHVHWDDDAEDWTSQRKEVTAGTSSAGGGHAHAGLMIYLGDNWPDKYRGELFTLNLHGRRVNQDHLERAGATYIGRHRPDLLSCGDPWFRGIDLAYGADGGVYLLDWSDIGECHEADGLHRTSGRVYKVTWKKGEGARHGMPPEASNDVARLSNQELVALQTHRNEWLVRQSRRVLQERATQGDDLSAAHRELQKRFEEQTDTGRKLRALWCLYATGGLQRSQLLELLRNEDEHLRLWAIRLLLDRQEADSTLIEALGAAAQRESSGLVLTFLASALQRLPLDRRFAIAGSIAQHSEFADDRVLPLMLWYGIEPAVLDHPDQSLQLIRQAQMPKVVRYVARRLTGEIESHPAGVAGLVEIVRTSKNAAVQREVLQGMAEALRGWSRAPAPPHWLALVDDVSRQPDGKQLAGLIRQLSVVFGQGLAIDEVLAFVADRAQPAESRRQAIRSLLASRAAGLNRVLEKLLEDSALVDEAVRGLATLDLTRYAPLLLDRYGKIDGPGKDATIEVLASRADTARLLLDAIDQGIVPAAEVDPFLLRQMQLLGDDQLVGRIARIWPDQRLIASDKLEQIKRYRAQLDERALSTADVRNGRKVYQQSCGQCHKLFGEGGTIGPELTGAQRNNLSYWLENILDPSAAVPEQYRMSIVVLSDGRVLSGLLEDRKERNVALQTPTERLVLERSSIETIKSSELSLMPDRQLDKLSDADLRDLIAYLMSSRQGESAPEKRRDDAPSSAQVE